MTNCDIKELKYTDVTKYEWLKPFILDSVDFKGKHDLDNGKLEFEYKINNDYILRKLDSIAISNSWEIFNKSKKQRIYIKNIQFYKADNHIDTLKIINTDNTLFYYSY